MCLDNLNEIADAVKAAKEAADKLREFDAGTVSGIYTVDFTDAETRTILHARVQRTEQALRDLGFNPPPKRVSEGDAQVELRARGVTLPGELPAARVLDKDAASE